jgi:hypothetical protein
MPKPASYLPDLETGGWEEYEWLGARIAVKQLASAPILTADAGASPELCMALVPIEALSYCVFRFLKHSGPFSTFFSSKATTHARHFRSSPFAIPGRG